MRKFVAAAAALFLGVGLALAGASVANADGEVSAMYNSVAHVSDSSWTLTGSTQAGYGVVSATITYGDGLGAVDAAPYCNFTTDFAGGEGTWGCTLLPPSGGFPVGAATLTAQYAAEGAPSTSSLPINFTVFADPVPNVTVTSYTNELYPLDTFSGQGGIEGGAVIDSLQLVKTGDELNPINLTAGGDCNVDYTAFTWSCDYAKPLGFATGQWQLQVLFNEDSEYGLPVTVDQSATFDGATSFSANATSLTFNGSTVTGVDEATITFADESTGTCDQGSHTATDWNCSFVPETTPMPIGTAHLALTFIGSAEVDTFAFQVNDYSAVPTLTFNSFTAGAGTDPATIAVTSGLTGNATTLASTVILYNWDGGTGDNSGSCPWESSPQDCSFTPGAGLWEIRAVQNWTPAVTPNAASLYFRIPAAPNSYAYPQSDGTVYFEGTSGEIGDHITVTDAEGGFLCAADAVAAEGDPFWSCTSESAVSPTVGHFLVRATDECTGEDVACIRDYAESFPDGFDASYVPGGVSAATELSIPGTTYSFSPAAVTVTVTPTAPATVAGVQFSKNGDGGEYPGCPNRIGLGEGSPDFPGIAPGTLVCSLDELAPGYWNVESYQDSGDGVTSADSSLFGYFFVPEAPTVDRVSGNSANALTITGGVGDAPPYYDNDYRASAGDVVHVMNGSNQLCTAIVTDGGTWACTTGTLAGATYAIRAHVEDRGASDCGCSSYQRGGASALNTPAISLTLPTLPTGGTTTPDSGTTPKLPAEGPVTSWTFDLKGLDLSHVHPGDKFTITGSGLPVGAVITIELHSTPITLGTATVGSDGTFTLKGTIPSSVEPGAHHIVATLTGSGLTPSTVDKAITVEGSSSDTTSSADTSSTSSKNAESTGTEGGNAHEIIGFGGAPNILTHSMTTLQDVLAHPAKINAAIAIGLVLIIFAMVPAHLLNATIAEQYERFSGRLSRIRKPKWFERFSGWLRRAPAVGGILLTFVTALLFAFIDPKFGPNLESLRLVLALTIALFIVGFIANWISSVILRQRFRLDVQLHLRPLGLILTVVAVIVSRLLDFSPGFLIGLIMGLSIAERSAAKRAWVAVVVRTSVIFGLGLVAWLVYSFVAGGGHEGQEASFGTELFSEALIAITTEGIVMVLVELLPIRLLEGERLWQKSKLLWSGVYFAVLVLFVLAVVPWEGNWEVLGTALWAWIAAVVAFGAVCMGFYLYFRFWAPPLHHESHEELEREQVAIGDDS
ncbi:MAG: hypothetical protein ABI632_04665 [Pseudolysinimonas sp.]